MNPIDRSETLNGLVSGWVRQAFKEVIGDASVDVSTLRATPTTNPEFGDYQSNDALALAKLLKKKPREIAEDVAAKLKILEGVESASVAGPGFINIRIGNDWLMEYVKAALADGRLGVPALGEGRTIIMDYGGPNICKPLHIGHLRSPNIGSTLDRMYRFMGYKVISDSHLGDWGTQFGIIIAGFRKFGEAEAMKNNPMEELERVYVKSHEKAKSEPEWMNVCRQELVKLQAGDQDNLALWKQFVDLTRRELDRVNAKLGFSYDLVRGESYYQNMLAGTVDELVKKGIVRESEGALVAFLDDEKLPPAIVRKSDGGFNYATTDIATILDRIREFRPERVVYVTDERQQLHFRQVFAICRRLGVKIGLDHIWFGLMRLPEGTFSTRDGNVIRLERLMEEAEERALAIVRGTSPDKTPAEHKAIASAVGVGAVKYADLGQNPQTTVTFTWDKALSLEGNSGPYLQYAYARIASLSDKYTERFPGEDAAAAPMQATEAIERTLALHIGRFPDALVSAAQRYCPSALAEYLYEMSQIYNNFYQNVPVLKAPDGMRQSRVQLCRATARVLKQGLTLLGLQTPERI